MSVTIESILAARRRLGEAIYHSPCPYSLSLSRLCGCEVFCKLDHLQLTGSFKERGARNKLLQLDAQQREVGVIAASAGNHALGLAYHGQDLGIPVMVVMPKWTPLVKLATCRELGAEIVLEGERFEEARQHAVKLAEQTGRVFVSGYDDPDIIAGQGTLGLEILEDLPDVEAVLVPVGGGGLISGIGTAIKHHRPEVRIIGIEPTNAPTLSTALQHGGPVRAEIRPTLADGLAVAHIGRLCFEIAQQVMDELVLVDEAQIARAILRLLEMEKMVIEGAGAVTLAALMRPEHGLRGKRVVLLLSGGNIDLSLISRVIDRGLAADGRLCRLVAHISDRPGSLARLTAVLASTGASVKEVSHDRHFSKPDVALVSAVCVLETRDFAHIEQIHAALGEAGIEFDVPVAVPPARADRP